MGRESRSRKLVKDKTGKRSLIVGQEHEAFRESGWKGVFAKAEVLGGSDSTPNARVGNNEILVILAILFEFHFIFFIHLSNILLL